MPTTKQVIRAYSSAVKAAERDRKRRAREAAKRYKEHQKLQEIADAASKVETQRDYLDVLTSIHKISSDKMLWRQVLKESAPIEPKRSNVHETTAQNNLDSFKPSLIQQLFGYKSRLKKLEESILTGKELDERIYQLQMEELEAWRTTQSIAKGVLNQDVEFYEKAIDYFDPFNDIDEIGSKIEIVYKSEFVEVEIHVNDEDIIPKTLYSQTKTGKLSEKNMPKGKFNEYYQDYVCGAALRVGREVLAYLPVKMVAVHIMLEMVNSSTGHLEENPILSVAIPPETIDKLNFETLDPSDAMKNFLHNMKFSKTKGFSPVDKVEASNLSVK